jgi:hypothetical protein
MGNHYAQDVKETLSRKSEIISINYSSDQNDTIKFFKIALKKVIFF